MKNINIFLVTLLLSAPLSLMAQSEDGDAAEAQDSIVVVKRARKAKKQEATREDDGCKETGKAALYTYLRREYVAKGIDLRTSTLVRLLSLSEEELKFIESGEPLPL